MANDELKKQQATASSFPEHGPLDENGKYSVLPYFWIPALLKSVRPLS